MRGSFFVGFGHFFRAPAEQLGPAFAIRNAPSIFLLAVLNVSRMWPRDLEPLGGDIDCAKSATLRERKTGPSCSAGAPKQVFLNHKERAAAFRRQPCSYYNIVHIPFLSFLIYHDNRKVQAFRQSLFQISLIPEGIFMSAFKPFFPDKVKAFGFVYGYA